MPETVFWKKLLIEDPKSSSESELAAGWVASEAPMSHSPLPIPPVARQVKQFSLSKTGTTGKSAEVLAHVILLYMLLRTLYYIYRRKNGRVGPTLLSPLLKFWATWGLLHSFTLVLSLYLSPLGLAWLISCFRAACLLGLSWGSTLSFAGYIYDAHVHRFLQSHESEIEAQFSALREKWAEVKLRLTDILDELMTRYAVGGVAGVTGRGPGQKEVAEEQADQFDPSTGRRVRQPRLPVSHALSASEQKFFKGSSDGAEESVAETAYRGVLIKTKHDAPKPAYTGSRALRESFRKRARGAPAVPKNDDAQ